MRKSKTNQQATIKVKLILIRSVVAEKNYVYLKNR